MCRVVASRARGLITNGTVDRLCVSVLGVGVPTVGRRAKGHILSCRYSELYRFVLNAFVQLLVKAIKELSVAEVGPDSVAHALKLYTVILEHFCSDVLAHAISVVDAVAGVQSHQSLLTLIEVLIADRALVLIRRPEHEGRPTKYG